jgi:hypothetical protein
MNLNHHENKAEDTLKVPFEYTILATTIVAHKLTKYSSRALRHVAVSLVRKCGGTMSKASGPNVISACAMKIAIIMNSCLFRFWTLHEPSNYHYYHLG